MDEMVADAVQRLTAAGARDELLVELVRPRRMGLRLTVRLATVERVWRLGVLLLGHEGALYATGTTLRVSEPRHPNAQSQLAEQRRELRAIALKSGIADGETINLDAVRLSLDDVTPETRPLARTHEGLFVRWSPTSDARAPFDRYLADRVELLIHPPAGT